jgi:hypothetical protein
MQAEGSEKASSCNKNLETAGKNAGRDHGDLETGTKEAMQNNCTICLGLFPGAIVACSLQIQRICASHPPWPQGKYLRHFVHFILHSLLILTNEAAETI